MRAIDQAVGYVAGSNMDLRPGENGSGLIAFLVVAGLVIVCVLLFFSLRKHLRKIDFESPGPPDGPSAGAGSAGSEPT